MPATLRHEHDNVYRLDIGGTLTKPAFDVVQGLLLDAMARTGVQTVRLLVVLEDFEGWEAGGEWGDLTFYMTHGDRIERVALVGDQRWREQALMFAAADLRRGPVEFFTAEALDDARAWLAQ